MEGDEFGEAEDVELGVLVLKTLTLSLLGIDGDVLVGLVLLLPPLLRLINASAESVNMTKLIKHDRSYKAI